MSCWETTYEGSSAHHPKPKVSLCLKVTISASQARVDCQAPPPDANLCQATVFYSQHFRGNEALLLRVTKGNIRRPFKRTTPMLLLTASALTAWSISHSAFKINLNEKGWIQRDTSSVPVKLSYGGKKGLTKSPSDFVLEPSTSWK